MVHNVQNMQFGWVCVDVNFARRHFPIDVWSLFSVMFSRSYPLFCFKRTEFSRSLIYIYWHKGAKSEAGSANKIDLDGLCNESVHI